MTVSIAFLLTTISRFEVTRMLNSLMITAQPQDHIYLACDGIPSPYMRGWLDTYRDLCPCSWTEFIEPQPLGYWGHALRNKYQGKLSGDYLYNIDDDDILETGFNNIRAVLEANPGKITLARFVAKNRVTVWQVPAFQYGNLGTPSGFIPNEPGKLGTWRHVHGGDFLFYNDTVNRFGGVKSVIWVDQVVYRCNPEILGYR